MGQALVKGSLEANSAVWLAPGERCVCSFYCSLHKVCRDDLARLADMNSPNYRERQ